MSGRRCEGCPTLLSRFNDDPLCWLCADKAARAGTGRSEATAMGRLVLFEMLEPGYDDALRLRKNPAFARRLARYKDTSLSSPRDEVVGLWTLAIRADVTPATVLAALEGEPWFRPLEGDFTRLGLDALKREMVEVDRQRLERRIAAWAHDRDHVASVVAPEMDPNAVRQLLYRWRARLVKRVGASFAEYMRVEFQKAWPDDLAGETARAADDAGERFAADYHALLKGALRSPRSA